MCPSPHRRAKKQAIRIANRQLGEVNAMGLQRPDRARAPAVPGPASGHSLAHPLAGQQAIVRQRIDCCRQPQRPWRAACFQMFLPLPLSF